MRKFMLAIAGAGALACPSGASAVVTDPNPRMTEFRAADPWHNDKAAGPGDGDASGQGAESAAANRSAKHAQRQVRGQENDRTGDGEIRPSAGEHDRRRRAQG